MAEIRDRFKFRFWNKNKECYEDIYCCSSVGFLVEFVIPEQCTGIKDKNGKLIYEGDILKVEHGEHIKNKNYSPFWTVEWKNFSGELGFRVYGKDRRFNIRLSENVVFNSKAVVVGNIHEGKENEEYNLA